MDDLVNLFDFEAAALARLPAGARDYYRGGAGDELTLRGNREAWDRWQIHYRTLRDVSVRDPSTEVLGLRLDWPLIVAPTAFHSMAHGPGECATVRAAAGYGVPMILSTLSRPRAACGSSCTSTRTAASRASWSRARSSRAAARSC
jgi:4-hydroxymandelate oxidase